MQFKKLGFATFEGGPTFWRSLLSGFTSGHKKLTLISGGRYFREVVTIGTLREVHCIFCNACLVTSLKLTLNRGY